MISKKKRRQQPKPSVTIEGVVALAEWSDDGSDAQVVILTDDDDEYFIETRDSGIKPSRFVNARVVATGRLFEREDYNALDVKRIRIVDSNVYDDDEENPFEGGFSFDDDVGVQSWLEYGDLSNYVRYIRGSGAF